MYNIVIVMRSSAIIRILMVILFAIIMHITLYFAKQAEIYDYIIYISFAMASVPTFLFVLLGTNDNDSD